MMDADSETPYFPFSAIVGQENMKDALLCNAVHQDVGGVLISGTRGTAKSTAVRSLARLLPRIRVVKDCPYNCPPDDPEQQCSDCRERDFDGRPDLVEERQTPFVDLPLGSTEDRVLGTFDLETAIRDGERSFEPGLLAQANRGILYVDEVNLLSDHLVDVLLDAVASGTNRVEREGISVEHPANVMLVGTMNPEEGDLRPQLLDRFGLSVNLDRSMDPDDRKAVVRRRTQFDADPEGMMAEWHDAETELRDRIGRAKEAFSDVAVPDELLDTIVGICVDHDVDGLRADIVIHRTARALAAFDGHQTVTNDHVTRAAELALGHRSTLRPSPEPRGPDSDEDDEGNGDGESESRPDDEEDDSGNGDGDGDRESTPDRPDKPPADDLPLGEPDDGGDDYSEDEPTNESETTDASPDEDGDDDEQAADADDERVFPVAGGIESPETESNTDLDRPGTSGRGGGVRAESTDRRGAYTGSRRPRGRPTDLALDATVRAAAPHQSVRDAATDSDLAVTLRPSDLREKVRQSRVRNLVVFVVDSSGSMGAYERMSAVKGAILSLLEDAYQNRDAVSLVGFREDRAETLLAPTSSVSRAAQALTELPTGGRTPLAAGLSQGLQMVQREQTKQTALAPLLVLVTDGRSNYTKTETPPLQAAMEQAARISAENVPVVCFDTETGPVRMGQVRRLADEMGASYHRLDELEPSELSEAVKAVFGGTYGS